MSGGHASHASTVPAVPGNHVSRIWSKCKRACMRACMQVPYQSIPFVFDSCSMRVQMFGLVERGGMCWSDVDTYSTLDCESIVLAAVIAALQFCHSNSVNSGSLLWTESILANGVCQQARTCMCTIFIMP